ncbi:carboxylic ester hydrolase-like [Nomia melanderi]|uniref:carboxylic ester hydrolase-like n=1 Tax=Nomia melanderi TaxID=2448451 RepID=UPI003FCC98AC
MDRQAGIALLLLLSLTQCLTEDFPRTKVVYTNSGPVRGIIKKTVWNSVEYSAFLGIPYALPPVKDLRFKPPVPAQPWDEVFDAVQEGSVCPQIDFFYPTYMGVEDCLYLNVYTTGYGSRTKLKPVMVWIYGGAYSSGYGNSSLYGPDFFLEEGVVFVSFNYRVGVLGFLSLDHPDALGNAGLKDQNLVLQWVRDNIAAFGGNPYQVTIFGESAGGGSVGFHILSEKSKGLFHRSISMSGTPLCQWAYHTPDKARENAYYLATLLGHPAFTKQGLLDYLRTVPAEDLVKVTEKVDANVLPFRPTVEDPDAATDGSAFLTECPISKYNSGDFTRHPMMLGHTRDEALFFLNDFAGDPSKRVQSLSKWIRQVTYIRGFADSSIAHLLSLNLETVSPSQTKRILAVLTDTFFTAPIDLTQKLLSKWNDEYPIYYYRLSYESKYSVHSLVGETVAGTSHVDDIGNIFNVAELNAPTNPNHPFNVFRQKMVKLWANFAKYGNPTPRASRKEVAFDVNWLDSRESGMELEINEESILKTRLVSSVTNAYEQFLMAMLPFESGCKYSFHFPGLPSIPGFLHFGKK